MGMRKTIQLIPVLQRFFLTSLETMTLVLCLTHIRPSHTHQILAVDQHEPDASASAWLEDVRGAGKLSGIETGHAFCKKISFVLSYVRFQGRASEIEWRRRIAGMVWNGRRRSHGGAGDLDLEHRRAYRR